MGNIYHNAIYVTSPDKIPAGEHWAIVEFGSVTIPGDERSRSSPGHGYPEHQETTVSYTAYLKREDFEDALQGLAQARYGTKPFRCIHVASIIVAQPQYKLEERT